jgi:hypothetical protein
LKVLETIPVAECGSRNSRRLGAALDPIKDYNFWTIVAYLLPGLLIVEARALAARSEFEPITKETLITFAIATVFYDLILWAFGFAVQIGTSISSLDPIVLFKVFVFVPIILGFVFGLAERYGLIQRALLPFGINAPLPFKAVWMEIFPEQAIGTYMIVTLKDGTMFHTMVTADSRFSSNAASPDLYFGQIFSVPDWKPANPIRGVYLTGEGVRSIEIIKNPN